MNQLADYFFQYYVLLIIALVLLISAALFGKSWSIKRAPIDKRAEDELKIIVGATLSLFSLLVGFTFSFAINGYQARVQAEENEAIIIGNAYQRVALLDAAHRQGAISLLDDYLQQRIRFYTANSSDERISSRLSSLNLQSRMWRVISNYALQNPNSVVITALNACNDLYTAQEKAMSSWQRQVPAAAWVLLLVFALCSNFLLGYNMRGVHGSNFLIMLLPALITLALFMISEIDSPGANIIHVSPKNLEVLRQTLLAAGQS